MDRRKFLHGMVIGAAAVPATALVKMATPEDVRALTATPEVLIGPNVDRNPSGLVGTEVYIFHEQRYMPIGYLTSVHVNAYAQESARVRSAWTGEVAVVPGISKGTAGFAGGASS